jgi:hypothetical protein
MSFIRLILFFLLIYVVYHVVKLFIVNFRIGANNKENFQSKKKPESKYESVEEAEFTEIKKKDDNTKK